MGHKARGRGRTIVRRPRQGWTEPCDPRGGMKDRQRVLVVEDDPDTREMMAELLQPHCAVAVAADGTDALELLTRNGRKFDAIVVDLEMPGLGGLALLSNLRQRGLNVPALVVSGAPG